MDKSVPSSARGLSWFERAALLVGIVEITLQIDKYFMFHEHDATLGAVAGLNVSVTTIALMFLYARWISEATLSHRQVGAALIGGLPMLVYIGITAFSSLTATLPLLSLFDVAILVQAYLLFFYIANRLQTHRDIAWCLLALATTLIIQCLAICFVHLIGMDNEERSFGPLMLAVHEGRRHAGTMHSPVLAGSTLALIWLPVAASLLFIRNRWAWRFILVATILGLLAILMTQTRGAILTSVVGSMIIGFGMLLRGWLPRWTIMLAVVLAMLSAYPLFLVYQKRIQHGDGDSAVARKHLSLIALQLISERPLSGHGAGNCHLAAEKIANQGRYRAEWFYTTHSKYLLVWVETGLFGLLAFLAVIGNGFRQGIATWRTRDPALSTLGLALAAAIAGHSLHMAVDIFNSRTQVQMLWCILGLVAAVYRLSCVGRTRSIAPRVGLPTFSVPSQRSTTLAASKSLSSISEGGLS